MSAYNKLRKNVIILSCCILLVIVAFVCISVFLSGKKKEKSEVAEKRTIASIGDFKITENQFKFFARIILNQEEDTVKALYNSTSLSDKDEIKKYTSKYRLYQQKKLLLRFESPTVWYGLKSAIKLINNYNTLWLLKKRTPTRS